MIEKLEKLFSKSNEKFNNGELQIPIITISPDTTKEVHVICGDCNVEFEEEG